MRTRSTILVLRVSEERTRLQAGASGTGTFSGRTEGPVVGRSHRRALQPDSTLRARGSHGGRMKRYQDVVLFLLLLVVVAQAVHVVVRPGPPTDGVAPAPGVLVGDTLDALTGYVGDGVLGIVPLDADPGTVTVLYAFNSECAFCDDVAPEWAGHFTSTAPAGTTIRRIAVTRDLPSPAATYAERFGWQVDLLSIAQVPQPGRESSLVSRTPWIYVLDSDGVLRFQDHGAELRRVEEAIAAIQSPGAVQMTGGGG